MCDPIGVQIRLEMARQRISQKKMCELASISHPTMKKILELDDLTDCKMFLSSVASVAQALNKKLKLNLG